MIKFSWDASRVLYVVALAIVFVGAAAAAIISCRTLKT